jgi:hypothetical protein
MKIESGVEYDDMMTIIDRTGEKQLTNNNESIKY